MKLGDIIKIGITSFEIIFFENGYGVARSKDEDKDVIIIKTGEYKSWDVVTDTDEIAKVVDRLFELKDKK